MESMFCIFPYHSHLRRLITREVGCTDPVKPKSPIKETMEDLRLGDRRTSYTPRHQAPVLPQEQVGKVLGIPAAILGGVVSDIGRLHELYLQCRCNAHIAAKIEVGWSSRLRKVSFGHISVDREASKSVTAQAYLPTTMNKRGTQFWQWQELSLSQLSYDLWKDQPVTMCPGMDMAPALTPTADLSCVRTSRSRLTQIDIYRLCGTAIPSRVCTPVNKCLGF
ncbi:hypothetical protein J6590_039513 [Homalodisca vitripennis]|nr:hypothetical protein J6590_039513 [Homalodisca vitripennis]